MTLAEFQAKWGNISTKHDPTCEKRGGFDYELCTCGHDEQWQQRDEDLRTVPHEELEKFHNDLRRRIQQ